MRQLFWIPLIAGLSFGKIGITDEIFYNCDSLLADLKLNNLHSRQFGLLTFMVLKIPDQGGWCEALEGNDSSKIRISWTADGKMIQSPRQFNDHIFETYLFDTMVHTLTSTVETDTSEESSTIRIRSDF